MTRQRNPDETYCIFANFKQAVDSKTDINQNGVQIIKQKSEMRSFESNENIHKKEVGPYYVVSANKASSVTL